MSGCRPVVDLCSDDEDQRAATVQQPVWLIDEDDVEAPVAPAEQQQQHQGQAEVLSASQEQSSAVYVLDCGCQYERNTLKRDMQQQAGQLRQKLGSGPARHPAVAEVAACLSCSACGSLLSAQDVMKLLGPGVTCEVYVAFASGVKQATLQLQQLQDTGHTTHRGSSSPTAADTVAAACIELWQELTALQALLLGGDPPAASGAGHGRRRAGRTTESSQKQQAAKSYARGSGKSSGAWAAGTGYGGTQGGLTKQAHAAMSAAAQRQAAADAAMASHLQAVTGTLQDPLGPSSNAGLNPDSSRKRGRGAEPGLLSLPWPLCGLVLAGPLAWLLRLLFTNDSLMDVVARSQLYSAGMGLLRHVSTSTDLLPLLLLPADDPRDTSPAATSSAAACSSSSSTTLLDALKRLEQQARLYQRSAEQLMAGDGDAGDGGDDDDEGTTAAVCLALDLTALVQDLQDGLSLVSSMMQGRHSLALRPMSAQADPPQTTTTAAAAMPAGASSSRRRGRAPAAPAAPPQPAPADPSAAAAAAHERRYAAAMQPYRFIEADLLSTGHYFARDAEQNARRAAGGEVMRRRLRRLTEELGALSTSLPLSADSSILLAVHSDRMDVLRALLLPHPDTPYGGGAFVFDILLPPEYPDKPPQVQFLTTGGGQWRANPNLYNCGKVCLSLLGTWSGPSWEPGVSTLLQVLVSLQSMVFVPDPYFNEPGYERSASTASGRAQAAAYNAGVRLGTVSHALLPALTRPDPVFADALRVHYSHTAPRLRVLLQHWLRDTKEHKQQLAQVVRQVEAELDKLPPPMAHPEAHTDMGQQQQQQDGNFDTGSGRCRRRQQQQQQQQVQQAPPAMQPAAGVDVVDLT